MTTKGGNQMKLSRFAGNIALAVSVLLSSVTAMASDKWPMYQANPSHTGYIPISINAEDISFRWKKKLGSLALNPVTAAKGLIFVSEIGYFGTQHFYVLLKNGSLAWGKSFSDIYSVNPPSYDNGKVYIQTGNHTPGTYLRAYNAQSGNLVFQSPHAAQWERYMSPTIYEKTVYISGGYYGGMYSFGGTTGRQHWFYDDLPQVDQWTPAVDDKWAYTYIGSLFVVDRLTGKTAFNILDSGEESAQVPMLGGANDVFVINGGMLSKFNTATKKIAWQKIFSFSEDYTGQPALANGVIYAGTTLGSLAALDKATGKRLWTWKNPSGESVTGNIVVTDSHVFLGTTSKIYCVDLMTHHAVWSYAASGHLTLAESALYVADSSGNLTAFRLGIGDLFAPSNVSFDKTPIDTTTLKKIWIKNVGDKPITINDIISGSDDFTVETTPTSFVLEPNRSKGIDVSFTPTTAAIIETDLLIKSDDQNEPEMTVHLRGKGI